MVTFLYRLLVAGVLAAVGAAFSGCVVAKLTTGFTLAPPGVYFTLAGFDDTPPPPPPAPAPVLQVPGQDGPPAPVTPPEPIGRIYPVSP